MTTLIQIVNPVVGRRGDAPTVNVAGVQWPFHKVAAVVVGIVASLMTLIVTQSGQATMWVTALAVLAVWWGTRLPAVAALAVRFRPSE